MSKEFTTKLVSLICLMALIVPVISGATFLPPAAGGGKQIVFLMADPNYKLTYVKIEGRNQRGDWVTWEKRAAKGMKIAYTKNWWWVGDFTKISFAWEDTQNSRSMSSSCSFDTLVQPKDTPYVYVIYQGRYQGCAGGEGGSARDPVAERVKPIKDALGTIDSYLSDFDMQVFLETLMLEANATVCTLAVATALKTGGLSLALAEATVEQGCADTAQTILEKIFIRK